MNCTREPPAEFQNFDIVSLLRALHDENTNTAIAAVQQLGIRGRSAGAAIMALIGIADSDCACLRGAVIAALGRINVQEPVCVPVIATALRDPVPAVRRYAIAALGEFDETRTLPWIVGALRDEDATVREFATDILTRHFCPSPHWL